MCDPGEIIEDAIDVVTDVVDFVVDLDRDWETIYLPSI